MSLGLISDDSSFDSSFVGFSAKGNGKHTLADGQIWGSPFWPRRVAFDVSIVNPTAVSHSGGAGACAESFLNPNAGTRNAEKTKTDKYRPLCQQRGMDVVPIIFTSSGGRGEQFQRRYCLGFQNQYSTVGRV